MSIIPYMDTTCVIIHNVKNIMFILADELRRYEVPNYIILIFKGTRVRNMGGFRD